MKRLWFLLLIILIISGCSRNTTALTRNYKGESNHWTGLYQVVGTNSNHETTEKLIYKGSDPGSVGRVKYSYKFDLTGEGFGCEAIITKDKEYIIDNGYTTSRPGENGDVITANDTVEVTVEWNGQIEKFTLSPTGPIQM